VENALLQVDWPGHEHCLILNLLPWCVCVVPSLQAPTASSTAGGSAL
jgi:hypothetical protein